MHIDTSFSDNNKYQKGAMALSYLLEGLYNDFKTNLLTEKY